MSTFHVAEQTCVRVLEPVSRGAEARPDDVRCTRCHRPVRGRFCTACGAATGQSALRPGGTHTARLTGTVVLRRDNLLGPGVGAPRGAGPGRACPGCSRPARLGAKFCTGCGVRLDGVASDAAAVAGPVEQTTRLQAQGIRPAVWICLASQLVMGVGAFMALPFLAVYLSRTLRLSPAEVGTILTTLVVASRLLPSITGPLADRVGFRLLMVCGVFLRAAGFGGFVFVRGWWLLLLMALCIGVGGALYDPAVNAVFAAQPEVLRPRIFTLHNQLLNGAVILGPALGGLLVGFGAGIPFLVTASCYVAIGVTLAAIGPLLPQPARSSSVFTNYARALRHRPFRAFWLVMVPWWIIFSQLYIAYPIKAMELGHSARWVSLVFLSNGIAGMAAMLLVTRLSRSVRISRLVLWGFVLASLGFGLVPVFQVSWWLLVCVAVYTLGESLILPSSDIMVAGYTDEQTAATFFGLFSGSWALGGVAGNYLGSWLSLSASGPLPWLLYASFGLLGAVGMLLYHRLYEKGSAGAGTNHA